MCSGSIWLGISVGFPEALVWITLFAFSYVFNVSNVTNKIVPMARWACASQQAIPSRVRELSTTIAIRVQRFHCFDPFSVPEASGHFCWFSGSSCLDDVVCIFIRRVYKSFGGNNHRFTACWCTYQVAYHSVRHLISTWGAPVGLFAKPWERCLLIK